MELVGHWQTIAGNDAPSRQQGRDLADLKQAIQTLPVQSPFNHPLDRDQAPFNPSVRRETRSSRTVKISAKSMASDFGILA
jgi:hypothetical protein